MKILIPDTIFDDGHLPENSAAKPCSLEIRRAVKFDDVSPSDWSAADAIVAHHLMPYGAEIADRAKNVRILVRVGVGVDNIDLPVWSDRRIPVCNVPDYGIGEVADHALALMLSLLRGVAEYRDRLTGLHDDVFDRLPPPDTIRRIAGLNCLIVGYGSIGREFAKRAAALGMNVGIFTRDADRDETVTALDFATLEDGLSWADVVSLHLPLSANTENLIGKERLAAMKPDSLLINTARGGLVDTGAVVAALQAGRLGGVGLDVFPAEPLAATDALVAGVQNREEWARGRVVLTPHVGGVSPQALEELRRRSVQTARDFLVDGTIRNRVA